jgi:hypothetical protein
MIGTKIRLKTDEGDADMRITDWLSDKNKEITGYLCRPDNDPSKLFAVVLDDEFEVLG